MVRTIMRILAGKVDVRKTGAPTEAWARWTAARAGDAKPLPTIASLPGAGFTATEREAAVAWTQGFTVAANE